MSTIDSATQQMRRDLLDRQDAWLEDQARRRGMTLIELAEIYTLEYEPIEVTRDENSDFIFRATQEVRLKRRVAPKPPGSETTDGD